MSDSDSDESINSEELNQLQSELGVVFEDKQVSGSVDRKGYTHKVGKKIKDATNENLIIETPKTPKKKPKGRPPKPLEEKLAKQIITKEKIIYMIPDNSGGYKEFKNPKLTKKDMREIENDKKFHLEQEEIGKKLIQKRNGTTDKRSLPKKKEPSQKQIDARLNFVANNKKRAEDRRKLKNDDISRIVHNTVVDVVTTPASQIQKKQEPVSTPVVPAPAPIVYTINKEDLAKKKKMDFLRKKMGM
jgi:hypothetical protein